MVRARFRLLMLVAACSLAAGCCNLSDCGLFSHFRRPCTADCTGYEFGDGEGPVVGEGGPLVVPPPGPGAFINPPMAPQAAVPELSPPPRLVPQPQQAQPTPYVPR
jgi:hypothetical protein